jgi:hypothetical protein
LQNLWRLSALSAVIFSSVTGDMGRSKEEGIADQESMSLSESQHLFSDTQRNRLAVGRGGQALVELELAPLAPRAFRPRAGMRRAE